MQRSKFGSYLGYTGRDGSRLGEAALDPNRPFNVSIIATLSQPASALAIALAGAYGLPKVGP